MYAHDGASVKMFLFPFTVRTPTYLRTFSSPSSYTNFARQRAITNSAVHSMGYDAYLVEPLISTQGGTYPPDVVKDTVCYADVPQIT
jgi:hypothetical protein